MASSPRMVAATANRGEPMSVVRTFRDCGPVAHFLPGGFRYCPRESACPSCGSTLILIRKVPTYSAPIKNKNSSLSAVELEKEAPAVLKNLESSLESARSANMILQALSFDAATRAEKKELEPRRLAEDVSYCPFCKVHVATNAEELERLLDDEGDEDARSVEWLRGSLLVAADVVDALSINFSRETPEVEEETQTAAESDQPPVAGRWQVSSSNGHSGPQPSILAQPSDVISAHDTLPQHLLPRPSRPGEFDYEHRHRVATHAMANRIGRGYSLLEDMCTECEMPLMEHNGRRECVVCPKLGLQLSQPRAPPDKSAERWQPGADSTKGDCAGGKDTRDDDPISAIISEARGRVQSEVALQQSNKATRTVREDVAEAKHYIMQHCIMGNAGGLITSKLERRNGKAGQVSSGCLSDVGSNGTGSLTEQTTSTDRDNDNRDTDNPIDWEELLENGRATLSEQLRDGWILSDANCAGAKCKGTPLLTQIAGKHVNLDYCVVCGGSGNGEDGAYEQELMWQAKMSEQNEDAARPDWEDRVGNGRALLSERLKQGWTMSSKNCCGFHCNDMPLTSFEGGPTSCVVCSGSGNGCDGAYENYKPEEIVEEERALVSQELSKLLSMGWVLRESLCVQCLMPLVAEDCDTEDDLCILCGHLLQNNLHHNPQGGDINGDSFTNDSYLNKFAENEHVTYDKEGMQNLVKGDNGEERQGREKYVQEGKRENEQEDKEEGREEEATEEEEQEHEEEGQEGEGDEVEGQEEGRLLNEIVNCPVVVYGSDNADEAGRKLVAGWTLANGLCLSCHGVLMIPPKREEIGCINIRCPMSLTAAHTDFPDPYRSIGPVRLIGRGFSDKCNEKQCAEIVNNNQDEMFANNDTGYTKKEEEVGKDEAIQYHHETCEGEDNESLDYGPPIEIFRACDIARYNENITHDELSALSEDLTQSRSVDSSALGAILVQLDNTKSELQKMQESGEADPGECAQRQVQIAMLIERLASATMRVRQRE